MIQAFEAHPEDVYLSRNSYPYDGKHSQHYRYLTHLKVNLFFLRSESFVFAFIESFCRIFPQEGLGSNFEDFGEIGIWHPDGLVRRKVWLGFSSN